MTKIYTEIDDELNKELRIKVIKKYGIVKGNLSKVIEEAIRLWLKQNGE